MGVQRVLCNGRSSTMNSRYIDAVEPTVIDEDLCRKCVSILSRDPKDNSQTPDALEHKKENIDFVEVECLIFSFKNILKIDNLVGFDRLKKLHLDNNVIGKIENLDHLHNLEWLDLSFNNISEIEGLEKLTSLTNISPFNNCIKTLENMDTLQNLHVLSIGNNLIQNLENVDYLRPFPNLQAVNFAGNPCCKESEYRSYVLAHMKHLKYLDYRLVDQAAVQAAKEQYQDALLELEEEETAAAAREADMKQRNARKNQLAEAQLHGLQDMFYELEKNDPELQKLAVISQVMEPWDEFR